MIDFELFTKNVHADMLQHASTTDHYIELNSPALGDINEICSNSFWNSLGLDQHRNTERDLEQQLKKISFSSAMAKLAQHPPRSNGNILVKGLPSAGKTIALSRIGELAIEDRRPDDRVIHFCTIQYYTGQAVRIRGWSDLWKIIIQCHVNDKVAEQGLTLEEFSKLHSDQGRKPTMLIDTLDLLTYGVDPKHHARISSAWVELLEQFSKHGIFAIWTCRTHELQMLVGSDTDEKKRSLTVIELPPLNHHSVKSLVEKRRDEFNLTSRTTNSLQFLVHAFPITVKLLQANQRFRPSRRFIQHFNRSVTSMRYKRGDNKDHPIVWVMNQQKGLLSIDVMYRFLKEEIFNLLIRDLKRPFEDALGKGILNEKWNDLIEKRFHQQSIEKKTRFGTRLSVPRKIDHDYHELDSGQLIGLSDQDILDLFVHYGELFGLFNRHHSELIFSHQLFSEYCVWHVAKEQDPSEASMLRLNKMYPSLMLRMADVRPDHPNLEQYVRWVFPLSVGSDLHHQPRSVFATGQFKKQWLSMWSYACKANGATVEKLAKEIEFDPVWRLTTQQEQIINKLPLKHPLFLDAPPGTGKTFIAANFIHRMSELLGLDLERGKASVMFLTMSPFLREQFNKRIDEHFTVDGGLDDARHDILLNSMSVTNLLFSLQRNVLRKPIDETSFHRSLLTKSHFEKCLNEHQLFTQLKNKYSVHALWHEFLTRVHKKNGSLCQSVRDYIETNSKGRSIYTLFHQTNVGETGESGRGSTKKAEREAKCFFDILTGCDLLSDNARYTTISKRCEETIIQLMKKSSSGSDDDQFWERLIPFLSDITVIDEIQDLNFSMLKLAMILHRGNLNGFYFSGDDEQTLSWEPFDWEGNFGKAVEFIRELRINYPNSRIINECVNNWWSKTLHRQARAKERLPLTMVERNLPEIVDFIRDSFKTSISTIPREDRFHGTANIIESPRMAEKHGELLKRNVQSGVFWVQHPIGKDDIINIGVNLFQTPNAPTLVLPNQTAEDEVRRWFQDKKINIPLWNPVSIKGLEFDRVIAISPWSADRDMLAESLGDDFRLDASLKQNDEVALKKEGAYLEVYKRIMGQLRRHSNVILSRPQYKLVVCEASEDLLNLYPTEKPKTLLDGKIKEMSFDKLLTNIADDNQSFSEVADHEPRNGDDLLSYVHMIKRFVDLIKTENSLKNSLFQGAHLLHLMEQGSGPDKMGSGNAAQKPELWNTRAPFLVVATALDNFEDLSFIEDVGGRSEELSVQLREKIVSDLIKRIKQQNLFPRDTDLARQVNTLCRIKLILNDRGKNGRELHYSPAIYDGFKELYNRLVTMLAPPPPWSLDENSNIHLDGDDELIFTSFVTNNLLGGEIEVSSVESWSALLRDYDFRDAQIKSVEGESQIPGIELMFALDAIAGDQNENDEAYWTALKSDHSEGDLFWKNGLDLLQKFSQNEMESLWFDIEPKFDGKAWSLHSKPQTRCILSMVCMMYNRGDMEDEAAKAAQLLRRIEQIAPHESERSDDRVSIKEVLLKSKCTPFELEVLSVKFVQMLAEGFEDDTPMHKVVHRNNFDVKRLLPAVSIEPKIVQRVYSHPSDFINDTVHILARSGFNQNRLFLQSWFETRKATPIQSTLEELQDWMDRAPPLTAMDLMFGDQHGLFADLEEANAFFTAHKSLVGGLLDEIMIRIYVSCKTVSSSISLHDIFQWFRSYDEIGGSTPRELLKSGDFNMELFLSRVYDCDINTDGVRPKVEFHRAGFEPIPTGLEQVDFLYERKSQLYAFENELLEYLGRQGYFNSEQIELSTIIREYTKSTKVFWRDEAIRLLKLKPHELRKEITNEKGRTMVNLDFLIKDDKIKYSHKQINDANNIILDAVIRRGLTGILRRKVSDDHSKDEPNMVRMAFYDRCEELFRERVDDLDKSEFLEEFQFHCRFGNRLNACRMELSNFVVLNEFLRTLKHGLFFSFFPNHYSDEEFSDEMKQVCEMLDRSFSFSQLVLATNDTIAGLAKKQNGTNVSTVLKSTAKQLVGQVTSGASDLLKTPLDNDTWWSGSSTISDLPDALTTNTDVMFAYRQIIIALTPKQNPKYGKGGGDATVKIVLDEAGEIELERRLQELCNGNLEDATPTEWLIKHTDVNSEALMNGSRTSEWRCKRKETDEDF